MNAGINDGVHPLPPLQAEPLDGSDTLQDDTINSVGHINSRGFFSNPDFDEDIEEATRNITNQMSTRRLTSDKQSFKIQYKKTETEKVIEIIGKSTNAVEYSFVRPLKMAKVGDWDEVKMHAPVMHYKENGPSVIVGNLQGFRDNHEIIGDKVINQQIAAVIGYQYLEMNLQTENKLRSFQWKYDANTAGILQSNNKTKIDGVNYYILLLRDDTQKLLAKLYVSEKFSLFKHKSGQAPRTLAFLDTFLPPTMFEHLKHTIFSSVASIILYWDIYQHEMKEHQMSVRGNGNVRRTSQSFEESSPTSPSSRPNRRISISNIFSETRIKQKVITAFKSTIEGKDNNNADMTEV